MLYGQKHIANKTCALLVIQASNGNTENIDTVDLCWILHLIPAVPSKAVLGSKLLDLLYFIAVSNCCEGRDMNLLLRLSKRYVITGSQSLYMWKELQAKILASKLMGIQDASVYDSSALHDHTLYTVNWEFFVAG